MNTRPLRTVDTRLPVAGAHVSRRRSNLPALPSVPAVLAAMLPLVGTHAYAASCDNVILPGGATCASTVAAGSAVNNTTVNSGATQKVKGTANASIINSGGSQAVSNGGLATSTVVNDSGVQSVLSGGSAVSTVISGGTQYVSSGGVAINTVVNSGGSFGVSNGGLAVGAVVSSGGLQRVYSGGVVSGNVVTGGKQYVSGGGTAVSTTVIAGSQVVFARGSAIDAVINSGAVQTVSSGGAATGTIVNGGAQQTVLLGGAAAGVVVAAGGTMTLDVGGAVAGGTAPAETVEGLSLAGTLSIEEAPGDNLTGGAAATIDTLTLNGGTVAFSAPGTGGYKTLTVNGLSGSGQFVLNTNVGAAVGDRLVVDQASGAYTLAVHDSSTAPPGANERLMLVSATNSTASFALAGNAIDVGAYKFALQDDGGQYYFYNTGAKSDIASVAQAASAMPTLLWYQQLEQTFAQLAEYRGGATDGQLWVRSFDQHLRTSPGGTATTADYYGVQIGRDWRIDTSNGNWHVGATAGFAQANEDFGSVGDGTARPWNIGAYGGYDGHNGMFVDAIVRYVSSKQAENVTSAANQASASYNLSGYSISLDGGQRLPLAGRWWIEPRAELTYQRSGSVDYQTTFGTLVGLGATNLMLGSAGVTFGASWMAGDFKLDPFINIAATHVFNGNVTDTVGGTSIETALPQAWFAASAGVSVALSRRTRAYGAFGYGKGHDYTQPWAATVGLSYALD
jgi:outer membrane autotransporter protein